MAAVYSTLFLNQAGVAGSITYDVPAGFIAVVRDCDIYGNNSDPETAFFLKDADSGATFFQWQITVEELGSPTHVEWRGRQVFSSGATLEASVSSLVSAAIDVRVCGYLLTAP